MQTIPLIRRWLRSEFTYENKRLFVQFSDM